MGTLFDGNSLVIKEVCNTRDESNRSLPIHVHKLSRILLTLDKKMCNCPVNVRVDSRVLIDCWKRQYSRSHDMLVDVVLKELF